MNTSDSEQHLSGFGFGLSDGGYLSYPEVDLAGTIRRRDVHGNLEELRSMDNPGWQEWRDVFPLKQLYFQPENAGESECGTSAAKLNPSSVYISLETAVANHPDCEILAFSDDDVAQPQFIDNQPSANEVRRFRVEALEKFVVRTSCFVDAADAEQAEHLCKTGDVGYDVKQIEDGDEQWIETVSVEHVLTLTVETSMKSQVVRVEHRGNAVEIDAYVSPRFPGIAVHRNASFATLWAATHIASGVAVVCDFRRRRLAIKFAVEAGNFIDFALPKDDVSNQMMNSEIRKSLRDLADKHRRM